MRGGGFFRPRLVAVPSRADEDQAERFRRVMLPHLDAAYCLARYLTREHTAAEDVVQEAFLKAYRAFPEWRGEAAKPWLLAIVRNCFRDSVSSMAARAEHSDVEDCNGNHPDVLTDRDSPESLLAEKSEAAMLRRTIERIPEPFREALVLRELEELSYREIATVTGVPIGTVMSRLARARLILAEMLLPQAAPKEERA